MKAQTITLHGERFVLVPEADYLRLTGEQSTPALPPADRDGHYPAKLALQVILSGKIAARRKALGWTQAALAERAKVRPETLNRIESGKHAPSLATVDKLERALAAGERGHRR